MKKNKFIFKAASILIITLLVFSSIVVIAHENKSQTYPEIVNITNNIYGGRINRDEIVWDNTMDYIVYAPAIIDEVNGIDIVIADDFSFTEETYVSDVHWIGGYVDTGYQNGDFDWYIVFYFDTGDGNAPDTQLMEYSFPQSQCNPVFIEDTGSEIYYDFTARLPEPFLFQGDVKYWVAIYGFGESPPSSCWTFHLSPIKLHRAVWGSDSMGWLYWTDIEWLLGYPGDMCFQLIASLIPDLACDGSLSWSGVKPGAVVTGSFEIENIGDSGSLLDWEIIEYPEWGKWLFEPDEGEDLTPETGTISINVTVIAPDVPDENFAGHVTIANVEDSSDVCIIDVALATPKNKAFNFYINVLLWLFERFPNTFPLLRYMLEL